MKDYQNFYNDLSSLISIKSVLSKKKKDAPFGEGSEKALNKFLEIAGKMGFDTVNYDNYAGEITIGKGEELGIIGHLDVVPEGDGWNTPPYTLTEKDGYLYGRGIEDDKAPMLIILYALKELKDEGIEFNRKIRFFVGTNEETGWKDIEYLNKKTTLPEYGFSPDGNFPVSYAEKGISYVIVNLKKLKNFYALKGGTVINAVCGYATVKAKKGGINKELLNKHGLVLKGKNTIESVGKAAHSSRPELGDNALKKLFEYFIDMGEDVKEEYEYLFCDKAGITKLKNEQGSITFSPDLAEENFKGITLKCDCRIPAPLSEKDVKEKLDRTGLNYKLVTKHETLMVDKDGFLVNALIKAYNCVTGEKGKPISQGGSTFARAFSKGVAFGPEFPDKPSTIHDANECMEIKDILKIYDIYLSALRELVK